MPFGHPATKTFTLSGRLPTVAAARSAASQLRRFRLEDLKRKVLPTKSLTATTSTENGVTGAGVGDGYHMDTGSGNDEKLKATALHDTKFTITGCVEADGRHSAPPLSSRGGRGRLVESEQNNNMRALTRSSVEEERSRSEANDAASFKESKRVGLGVVARGKDELTLVNERMTNTNASEKMDINVATDNASSAVTRSTTAHMGLAMASARLGAMPAATDACNIASSTPGAPVPHAAVQNNGARCVSTIAEAEYSTSQGVRGWAGEDGAFEEGSQRVRQEVERPASAVQLAASGSLEAQVRGLGVRKPLLPSVTRGPSSFNATR